MRAWVRVHYGDVIEKHLRGAVADATLGNGASASAQLVVCANQLLLRSRE
jgi:hypothetical protein